MHADTLMPQYLPDDFPRAPPWCLNTHRHEHNGREGTKKSKNIRNETMKTTARNQEGYEIHQEESKSGLPAA